MSDFEYCRFCAKLRDSNKLHHLNKDQKQYVKIEKQLEFLNASLYVNLSETDKALPKTICIICEQSLDKAFQFLNSVKEAQSILMNALGRSSPDPSIHGQSSPRSDNDEPSIFEIKKEAAIEDEPNALGEVITEQNAVFVSELVTKFKRPGRKRKYKKTGQKPKDLSQLTIEDLTCTVCDRVFDDWKTVSYHRRSHIKANKLDIPLQKRRKRGAPIPVEDITCDICNKVLSNKQSLHDHRLRHGERSRNYTCEQCGKAFYCKNTLDSHIKCHAEVRTYICKVCNRSYINPSKLRAHVSVHLDLKPFKCDECGLLFRTKRRLREHALTHTGIMPFQCGYCEKRFRLRAHLIRHERQHTGEMPFSCEECGREFRDNSNYIKHCKRKHNFTSKKQKCIKINELDEENAQSLKKWTSEVTKKAGYKNKEAIINTKSFNELDTTQTICVVSNTLPVRKA